MAVNRIKKRLLGLTPSNILTLRIRSHAKYIFDFVHPYRCSLLYYTNTLYILAIFTVGLSCAVYSWTLIEHYTESFTELSQREILSFFMVDQDMGRE